MKKLILALLVVFLLIPTVVFAGQNKIAICHLPPGNPSNGHTISIPVAQWEGSGGHSLGGHGGDHAGECQNPATTPTPTTTISPTPTSVPEPTATTTISPTPTSVPEPTVESELQGTIDQIIALLEKLVDFIQNL